MGGDLASIGSVKEVTFDLNVEVPLDCNEDDEFNDFNCTQVEYAWDWEDQLFGKVDSVDRGDDAELVDNDGDGFAENIVESYEACVNDLEPDYDFSNDAVVDLTYSTADGKRRRISKEDGSEVEPPTIGMVFDELEEIDLYLRSYAKQVGFGIVRSSGSKRQFKGKYLDELRNYSWKCECWGKKDTRQRVNGKKVHCVGAKGVKFATRKSKKCGCPVRVYTNKMDSRQWVLRTVELEHVGHVPTPDKTRFVTMFRQEQITPAVERRLLNDRDVGIKLPLTYRSMAKERNGLDNMGFTERDLRNVEARARKIQMDMEGGDANAMVNYFKKMMADNKKFYHAERVDSGNRLKDVFWVDARSQAAFLEFPDVVCFDSTYITNQFKLPFAVFVGVNHHGQTILFGCALLSHEDTETFEWLFKTWLDCMGVAPGGILTDQCQAMRKALEKVMPETRHRWCLWHILQKFSRKLCSYTNHHDIIEELQNVIYDSMTPEEFEHHWHRVITKYGLEDNEWLAGLYKEHDMWIPAHMKHMFWAGMKTTQRSESINSFFDGYVHKNTQLHQFASQYFAAMEARVEAEKQADEECERYTQELVSIHPFEIEFQKWYTTDKFIEFQIECLKLMYVEHLERKKLSEHVTEHLVQDRIYYRDKKMRKDIPTEKKCEYVVTFDEEAVDAWCVCKLFECHGIMCRHLLKVFNVRNVENLPEKFILRRWSKDVDREHTKVRVRYHDMRKTEEVKRHDKAILEFESLSDLAGESDENLEFVLSIIKDACLKLREKKNAMEADVVDVTSPSSIPPECRVINADEAQHFVFKDPPMPFKPRHRTTDTRYKSIVEVKSTAKAKRQKQKEANKLKNKGGKQTTNTREKVGKKKKGKKVSHEEEMNVDYTPTPPSPVHSNLNRVVNQCDPNVDGYGPFKVGGFTELLSSNYTDEQQQFDGLSISLTRQEGNHIDGMRGVYYGSHCLEQTYNFVGSNAVEELFPGSYIANSAHW